MKDNKTRAAFIGVAAVWFGGHIGPGFATGTSITTWFIAYGASGIFLPILSMAITAGVMYYMVEYARSNQVYNYKDYAKSLYGSGSKVMIPLYDLCFLVTVICAGGICMSGLASLLEMHLGIPYWGGIAGIIIITALLCLYGSKLVSMVSTYMMYFILATVLLIVIMSFAFGDYDMAGSFQNAQSNALVPSFGTALFKSVIYGIFQSTIAFNVIAVSDLLPSRADSKKAVLLGYILNVAMLMVGGLMVFSYTNVFSITSETLPMYSILARLGFNWLTWLYILLMVLAVLTSLAGLAYAGTVRFGNAFTFIKNVQARKIVIIVLLLGIAAAAAAFGLKSVMSTGNTYNGYVALLILVIPAYTVTRSRLKAKHQSEEK